MRHEQEGFKLVGESDRSEKSNLFRRGHFDLVVLNPDFVRKYDAVIVAGKNYKLFCKVKEEIDVSPILWVCEIVFGSHVEEGLPKPNQYIFNCGVKTQFGHEDLKTRRLTLRRQKALLTHQRLRVAEKLKNPRIIKIHYHTFRHFKATQLYHQTRDVLYVMKFLGHRDVKNTLIYIDLEIACFSKGGDEYHAKTARTETEALQLIETGFEYVCDLGEAKLFRKRR